MITIDDGDRAAVLGRRLVAPVREEVAARRVEEGRIGRADRLDRDHPAALVDRQPELERRFLLAARASTRDRAA